MNIDRFKRAIEIIEEKPDSQVMLKVWQQSNSVSHYSYISSKQEATCGTIACAAGWLALDPEMQAQGLKSGYGGQPEFHFRGEICGVSFRALGLFFDVRTPRRLGRVRGYGLLDRQANLAPSRQDFPGWVRG
jgi:hypothetical protein